MATSDNGATLNGSTWSLNCNQRRPTSEPLFCDNKDNRGKNFEDFLKDSSYVQPVVKNCDLDGINGDLQSVSSMSLSRELDDNSEEISHEDNINTPKIFEIQPGVILQADVPDLRSQSIDHLKRDQNNVTPIIAHDSVLIGSDKSLYLENEREIHVATPIITTHPSKPLRCGHDRHPSSENPPEFQIYSDQLNKLSVTIEQKDAEIHKLSKKLLELESRVSDSRKTSASKSSDSSSTDDKRKEKKNKKPEKKSEGTVKIKKGKKVKNKVEKETSSVCKDPVTDPGLKKTMDLPSIVKTPEIANNGDIIPNMRQKLIDLEDKVKRLQQANVDSIMSIERIPKHTSSYDRQPSDGVIKQLLIDHSILKDEFEQLRLEHGKLTQPNVFEDEIRQLKFEVNELQDQNDVLNHHIKSLSSKSLNLVPTLSPVRKPSEKIVDRYNDSLEPHPYNNNYPSNKHGTTVGSGEKWFSRRLSDSSSALMEDSTPKVWSKPVPNNPKVKPLIRSKYDDFDHMVIDQCSTDNFATLPSSEFDWKYLTRNPERQDEDLLSTIDTETLDETIESKPRSSYSFTPKSVADLSLNDMVKFARPGGKMSTGRVCYVGHLPGRREHCIGVELDDDAGKHDGKFEGVRYFQCRRNRGVFISFHKIILAYKIM